VKTKEDFVTNSSSTSFIITNNTKEKKTIVDFVKENPQLIQEFVDMYQYETERYNQENLIKSAEAENMTLNPGRNTVTFGDEDGTLIGQVFDYILRGGGKSKSFTWRFDEYLR